MNLKNQNHERTIVPYKSGGDLKSPPDFNRKINAIVVFFYLEIPDLYKVENMPNQMINYFNTQSSLSRFQFQFDPERWIPSAADLNETLKANKNLFNLDEVSWGKFNSMINSNISFNDPDRFDKLIDGITSTTNFSKIINPN